MRTETSPITRTSSLFLTCLLASGALFLVYVGIGVSVSLAQANGDAKAVAMVILYLAMSVIGPIAIGAIRSAGEHRVARATRSAALISLGAQVLFLPIALAAVAM